MPAAPLASTEGYLFVIVFGFSSSFAARGSREAIVHDHRVPARRDGAVVWHRLVVREEEDFHRVVAHARDVEDLVQGVEDWHGEPVHNDREEDEPVDDCGETIRDDGAGAMGAGMVRQGGRGQGRLPTRGDGGR